ncbi:hypothetical protein ACLOJK_029520 [Asimina triloba]
MEGCLAYRVRLKHDSTSLLGTVGGRMITGSSADADSGPLKDAMAWIICCSGSGRIRCCQSVDHCLMVSDDGSVKLKTLVFGAARGLASLEPMLAPGGWTTLAVRSGFGFFGSEVGWDADGCRSVLRAVADLLDAFERGWTDGIPCGVA